MKKIILCLLLSITSLSHAAYYQCHGFCYDADSGEFISYVSGYGEYAFSELIVDCKKSVKKNRGSSYIVTNFKLPTISDDKELLINTFIKASATFKNSCKDYN